MLFKPMSLALTTICTLCVCIGTSLLAHEENKQSAVRNVSAEEESAIQEKRLALIPPEVVSQMAAQYSAARYYYDDAQDLHRIHSHGYHSLNSLTGPGDYAKLEDGSIWLVHPYQRSIIKGWAQDHSIFIKPDISCLSVYRYVFHNYTANQVVKVNYAEAHPPVYANTVHVIAGIDSNANMIYLEDGSSWYMNPNDGTFKNWWIGDRMIVGVNNHWRTAFYPHILINASIKSTPYCEARAGATY